MTRKIYVSMLLILFSKMAFAEGAPTLFWDGGIKSLLATKDNFSITISDQVTGGCLPSPSKLKDKMEISLRKNGFKIEEDKGFTNNILIRIIGYKTGQNSCAVHISSDLYFPLAATVPFYSGGDYGTFVNFKYSLGNSILTGDRYSMQSRLEKHVNEFGDKLYLDISRSKDEIFPKFPSIKKGYEESKKPKPNTIKGV